MSDVSSKRDTASRLEHSFKKGSGSFSAEKQPKRLYESGPWALQNPGSGVMKFFAPLFLKSGYLLPMSEPRIKVGIWVQAVLRLGQADGRYGVVVRKGDFDAGGVLVVLRGEAGMMVLSQVRDAAGDAAWMRGTGAEPVNESIADGYVGRQVHYDSDLWVIEFQAPDYLPPFEAKII